jgi:hypothetical protein
MDLRRAVAEDLMDLSVGPGKIREAYRGACHPFKECYPFRQRIRIKVRVLSHILIARSLVTENVKVAFQEVQQAGSLCKH